MQQRNVYDIRQKRHIFSLGERKRSESRRSTKRGGDTNGKLERERTRHLKG